MLVAQYIQLCCTNFYGNNFVYYIQSLLISRLQIYIGKFVKCKTAYAHNMQTHVKYSNYSTRNI